MNRDIRYVIGGLLGMLCFVVGLGLLVGDSSNPQLSFILFLISGVGCYGSFTKDEWTNFGKD